MDGTTEDGSKSQSWLKWQSGDVPSKEEQKKIKQDWRDKGQANPETHTDFMMFLKWTAQHELATKK